MAAPENLPANEGFDYESLEAVLAAFRQPYMDKAQAAREAQAFFNSHIGQSLKISGDALVFVKPDGQVEHFEGIYKMPHKEVRISDALAEGVAVRIPDEWIKGPEDQPVLLYETIDPHPPGSLDEVPPEA